MRYSLARIVACFGTAAGEQCGQEIEDAIRNIAEDVEEVCREIEEEMEERKRGKLDC